MSINHILDSLDSICAYCYWVLEPLSHIPYLLYAVAYTLGMVFFTILMYGIVCFTVIGLTASLVVWLVRNIPEVEVRARGVEGARPVEGQAAGEARAPRGPGTQRRATLFDRVERDERARAPDSVTLPPKTEDGAEVTTGPESPVVVSEVTPLIRVSRQRSAEAVVEDAKRAFEQQRGEQNWSFQNNYNQPLDYGIRT
ncbi:hypothetical protein BDV97DRAFT_364989 [Delphinella strobiligena]|nr:hypothetical protein BDV97DRAFT_364989 [Delphinella strobiligena]